DVSPAGPIDEPDHRGDRRGLAGPRRAGHEHETSAGLRQALNDRWEVELLERLTLGGDEADGERDGAPLPEDVDAEPSHALQAVGEVGLVGPRELAPFVRGHQGLRRVLGVVCVELRERHRQQLPVDADERDVARGQVEIARAAFGHGAEQVGYVHLRSDPRLVASSFFGRSPTYLEPGPAGAHPTGRVYRTAASTTRSPSAKREGRSGCRSNVVNRPCVRSSADARPAARECIRPSPPNPTHWRNLGTSPHAPKIAWLSGVSGYRPAQQRPGSTGTRDRNGNRFPIRAATASRNVGSRVVSVDGGSFGSE